MSGGGGSVLSPFWLIFIKFSKLGLFLVRVK